MEVDSDMHDSATNAPEKVTPTVQMVGAQSSSKEKVTS